MKAVFQTKISPSYDDIPEHFYHFPHTYLKQVEAAIDDWIVYYEPRRSSHDERSRGGRQSYFAEAQDDFHRPMIVSTVTRPFRDVAFARQIQTAYDKKCAMTGLRIINGGGRPEAHAAHIRPVAVDGPDSIRNGVALSSTFHWMFDRGLISVDDDFRILIAKGRVPTRVEQMLNPSRTLTVPDDARAQPHRAFLRYHRENIFKG